MIVANDGSPSAEFGFSVSVSDEYAVIGAISDGSGSGNAYIFNYNGSGWNEEAKLTPSDGSAGDFFGRAVSISGDYAVVGAYGDDGAGERSGSAYVFVRNGTIWTQQQKLTAMDAAIDDHFGWSVSISGNFCIIGAHNADVGQSNAGCAYVFVRNGTTWTQYQKLTTTNPSTNDAFGGHV